jgi:hypothetical protein
MYGYPGGYAGADGSGIGCGCGPGMGRGSYEVKPLVVLVGLGAALWFFGPWR